MSGPGYLHFESSVSDPEMILFFPDLVSARNTDFFTIVDARSENQQTNKPEYSSYRYILVKILYR
jgi:hypothetical protein